MRRFAFPLALGLLWIPLRAVAAAVAPQQEEVGNFSTQVVMFVFLHELGHALIDLLDLPVVGREEDAADEFATLMLLEAAQELRQAGEQQQAETVVDAVVNAALSWRLMWKGMEPRLAAGRHDLPWWDEHSLHIQRFYNIVCMIYGSDPERFARLAEHAGLPEKRRAQCPHDYAQHRRAWEKLGAPYEVAEEETEEGARGRFVVVYGEAADDLQRQLIEVFREARAWEQIADELNRNLRLPEGEYPIHFTSCGEPNAFWDFGQDELTICLELYAFMANLYLEASSGQAAAPPAAPPGQLGPLSVTPGSDGSWQVDFVGRSLRFRNTTNGNAVYAVWAGEEARGDRMVSATLRMEPDENTVGAGILFGMQRDFRFELVLLPSGDQVVLVRASPRKGDIEVLRRFPAQYDGRARNRLELIERAGLVRILLNGGLVGEERQPEFGRGLAGIVVIGTGTFLFDDFQIQSVTGSAPAGQSAPGPAPHPQPPIAPPQQPPVARPGPPAGPPGPPPTPQPPMAAPQPPPPSPPPVPQPAPAPVSPALAGTWTATQYDANAGQVVVVLLLAPDGSFQEQDHYVQINFLLRVWGRWSATGDRMQFFVTGFEPRQFCDAQGCRPLRFPPRIEHRFLQLGPRLLQIGPNIYYRR